MESDYGFSLTTFSPSGKLVQIEYALARVAAGDTCLAIKARNGVVLATEKKLHPLMRPDSVEKVAELAPHIGAVYAGMNPDFRILAQQGRKRAQEYFLRYKDEIPTKELVKRMASIMQEYTQSGGVRPFGVSLLMGGWDDDGPHLFQVDPSGSYWAWKASALGKNMKNAKTFLEKRYSPDIELEDAIHTAILTLKEGFDGEMTAENVDIAVIGDDRKYKVLSEDAIRDYLTEVES